MQDWNAMSDDDFRREVVRFVEENCPAELRHLRHRPRWERAKTWYLALSRAGWLAPGWPIAFGGMGLSPGKHLVHLEEMERAGAPRVMSQGVMNLGPALLAHGTDEQRQHYLPRILSGEHLWCQGFSEPNAGSDLASLRTAAVPEGDEFVITGQKIWTSSAFDANMMFALVRTDRSAKPQAGISFIMFPMDQPGITVRRIRTIDGGEDFCEVFLDGARAHRRDLVGGLNDGWTVAKTLLGHERIWAGSPHMSAKAMDHLLAVAHATGKTDDPLFRDRMTELRLDVLDLATTYERLTRAVRAGGSYSFEPSVLKIWATETFQRITELAVEAAGDAGGLGDVMDIDGLRIDVLGPFLESRAPTIYGGSVQIHRNILAKGKLGLPG